MKESAEKPYPHKFHVDISLSEFIEKFSNLDVGQTLEDQVVTVAGIKSSSLLLNFFLPLNKSCGLKS